MSWKDKVKIIDSNNLKYRNQFFSYNPLTKECTGTRSIVHNDEMIKLNFYSKGSSKDEAIENMVFEINNKLDKYGVSKN